MQLSGSTLPENAAMAEFRRALPDGQRQYLVMRSAYGTHRIEFLANAAPMMPVVTFPLDAFVSMRLTCLEAFTSGKKIPVPARPTPYQASRLALFLAILDRLDTASGASATIRAIAEEVVFPSRVFTTRAIEWKSSSVRRQTQRLVAAAKAMRDKGYRSLLYARLSGWSVAKPRGRP